MKKAERLKYFSQIMWDTSIAPEEALKVFDGKRSKVGNYDRSTLFRRFLESYPWYTIIQLFSYTQIAELLTDEVISKLRSDALKQQYTYVRKRLQSFI
jgi:hypothetical protein